ncbi:hypothetical protein [Streptomyces djakartensis]|uniref:Uncharacterized protein n=1 Tax=Streptomyces djakartensis TaxID=68193 RepID=A0ABQ2ZPB4_9ACTN|nr:hypothetical protein [Streptomyces djakartensis]GGY19969.1 hypothetical protein GCM10010384_28040 [Streptomyces djakartensis]
MNNQPGGTKTDTGPRPQFWYGLPRGYLELDLNPTEDGVAELARQISGLPGEARERADQAFRLYATTVLLLRKQPVAVCALGMHPGGDGEASTSVLTLSAVPSGGANPTRVLAGMVGGNASDGMRPIELPVGIGFLTEQVRKTVAPGVPPEGQEGPVEGSIWQGTVAVPEPRTSSIIVVQLVTSSLELADDYRSVLLGTARTLTFTDPTAEADRGAGPVVPGSAAQAVRSDFG